MEGFVEEGGQMTVENYYSDQGKNNSNATDVLDLMDAYTQMLGSVEGQKGMFIGALLGGGVQGATVNKNEAKANERKLGLIKSMEEGIANISAASSIWKTVDGKTQVDPDKLVEQIKTNTYLAYNYSVLTQAAERGDTEGVRKAWDNIFVTFAKNYVSEEGGLEFMKEHFDELAESFLTGVNSFLTEVGDKNTDPAVKEASQDVQITKERLFKRAEALRQTYEDIQVVGPETFFKLSDSMKPEQQTAFASLMTDKTLRIANTIFSLKEELQEVNADIAKHASSQTPTSKTFLTEYLEPKKATLEKSLGIEVSKYNEMFTEGSQQKTFDAFKKTQDNETKVKEDLKKREKDFHERFIPAHKTALKTKGYEPRKNPSGNTTPKAGTFFKGRDGSIYRLSKTVDGKKNSVGSVYDLVNTITEDRIPYNDQVGMDYGFENADQILSRNEASALEKERRKKGTTSPGTVVEPEPTEVTDPDASEQKDFEDDAKKANPFSTMTAYFDRNAIDEGATNPGGLRWASFLVPIR